MIREKLCSTFKNYKIENKLSYSTLQQVTGLARSQLFQIMNHNGDGVKVERIEQAIHTLGLNIYMEIS
jgi:DNA-binding Xre family transcriptional regulator